MQTTHQCITNSESAFEILSPNFNPDVEEFWGLFLDSHMRLIQSQLIHRGTVNKCEIHPRDLFRHALRLNSFAIVIAHNHPSLEIEPSSNDVQLTKRLKKIGLLIQIPIIDHLIFSDTKYYSFKENKLL